MTPHLISAVREHCARFRFAQYRGQPTPWVFHRTITRGRNKAGDRITKLVGSVQGRRQPARLPSEFTQHDLRHRRVTAWLAEGASPVLVKEAVGHSDLRTTMSYTHLARERLRDLVAEPPKHRKDATA